MNNEHVQTYILAHLFIEYQVSYVLECDAKNVLNICSYNTTNLS